MLKRRRLVNIVVVNKKTEGYRQNKNGVDYDPVESNIGGI